jgi:hypothetical protein
MLERWFPPSFFDIMTHLVVNLVDEVELCGPVYARWCYGIERYIYVLKKYVRNKSRPEGSMATGYMYLGSGRVWDMDDETCNEGEVLEGSGRRRELSDEERVAIHEFIIANSDVTSALYRYFC